MGTKNKMGLWALCWLITLPTIVWAGTDSGMVTINAGTYTIGKRNFVNNPMRQVTVKAFSISRTEVTNEQFAVFMAATGYITDAERLHNSMVFEPGLREFKWKQDTTAYWRYPNGISRGGIEQKAQHPVTGISFTDAMTYCTWAGVRLPTLDEWEIACRAGSATNYFWGADMKQVTRYGNIWMGRDHLLADSSDGYMYTSPVASFQPNPWGLYDMYGNVFEFCQGKSETAKRSNSLVCARGGSWWCSKNSCSFFNSYDIGRVNKHASFSNQGFRVAANQ
jgi:formylglycine-generating enzyme